MHESDSYTLPLVWQFAQNVVSPASIAARFGFVFAPQLGQLGALDGKNFGASTLAQTVQVNVGRASDVMLILGLWSLNLGTRYRDYVLRMPVISPSSFRSCSRVI